MGQGIEGSPSAINPSIHPFVSCLDDVNKAHLDGELLGELLHLLDGRVDHVLAPHVAQQLQERQRRDDVLCDHSVDSV